MKFLFSIIVFFCTATLAHAQVDENLKAYYNFDLHTNNLVSGAHDGQVTGLEFSDSFSESFGHALSFDGQGHLDLGPNINLDESFSILMWINPQDYNPEQPMALISKVNRYDNNGVEQNFEIIITPNGRLQGITGNGNSWKISQTASPIATDEWLHVAFVYDAETLSQRIYLDGSLVGQLFNVPSLNNTMGTPTLVGAAPNSASSTVPDLMYRGEMDDLYIFEDALSQQDIGVAMSAGSLCLRTADFNCDGRVNISDMLMIAGSLGCDGDCQCDLTHDSKTNIADLLKFFAFIDFSND